MKKFLLLLFSSFFLILLFASTVSAVTLEAAFNSVQGKNIFDDAYIIAGNANIDADIFGDLYIGGGLVLVNGNIHEDLVVAGGRVTVYGNVGGDLRMIGGQLSVYGKIEDDLVVAGGTVEIGKNASVGGSIITGAGLLTMDGHVEKDIRGILGMLNLNGTVDGDINVTIQDSINISESAKIKGNLKYSALLEAKIPKNAVDGEISFNVFNKETISYMLIVNKVISYLSSLIITLFLIILTPKALTKAGSLVRENILKSFGIGLISAIILFIGSILLMVTIVGIPLALIGLALILIIIFTSKIFAAVWISGYIIDYKKRFSRSKLFGMTALILLASALIGIIPYYIGFIINMVFFIFGLGAIAMVKYEYYNFMKSKNMV